MQRPATVLMSLNQKEDNGIEQEETLRMDDYMWMRIRQQIDDSPMCNTECVSRCGELAELPNTEATQLVGCFEETCGCRNKWFVPADQADAE